VKTNEDARRGSISMARIIWDQADHCMRRKGFNGNFSAYVADLIRADHTIQNQQPPKPTKRK